MANLHVARLLKVNLGDNTKTMMKKNIRFLIISILSLALATGLASCRVNFNAIGEGPKMDNTMDTLLKAIQENDPDTIIQLFSEGVRKEVGDEKLEEGAEYLFALLEGDIVSKESSSRKAGETRNRGKTQRALYPNYKVVTTSDIYWAGFIFYTVDSITPDYSGTYNLWIKKESDRDFVYIRENFMGIYKPRTINDSEKDIPHEYKTEYGSFTVPAGYYKDDTVSTNEKYYFTVNEAVLRDVIYNHFSAAIMESEYEVNDIDAFHDYALADVNEIVSKSGRYNADVSIEEEQIEETAQGYPLLKLSVIDGNKLADKFFYIIGNKKYVLVQYTRTSNGSTPEGIEDEISMIAAAAALVDSFVWAD